MGFIRVSRNLLMFISVLSLTSATTTLPTTTTTLPPTTTTTQPTTTITTTQPTTTPPTTTLPALPTTPLPTTTPPPPPPTTPTTTPPPPPTTPPPTTTPPTTPTTPPPTTTTTPPPPTTTPPTTTTTTTPTTPTTSPTTTAPFTSSTTPTTSTTSTSANFYPFGSAVGDIQTLVNYGGEDSAPVNLTRPFVYFGRTYNRIYVNYNGLLSFNQPIIEDPYTFGSPYNGSQDLIAALWADFDDYGIIAFYYHEYTSGDVLTRATEDIKRYYPGLSFNATWVFVATWDYVQTWDLNTFLQHSAPSVLFQAVLISDGVFSFVLMNYGDMSVINYPVEAGYDTMGSTNYFVIPGSNYGSLIPSLSSTSNVNTPGRWAFSLNRENVIGLQIKVTSFLNLTDSGNLAFVMQKLKDELVNRGMPSYVRVTARKVQKTKP